MLPYRENAPAASYSPRRRNRWGRFKKKLVIRYVYFMLWLYWRRTEHRRQPCVGIEGECLYGNYVYSKNRRCYACKADRKWQREWVLR
jgi:hypothetical protein